MKENIIKKIVKLLVVVAVIMLPSMAEAQLRVIPGSNLPTGWTADSLVRNVLLGGGVDVMNVTFNGNTGAINCDMIGWFMTGNVPTALGMTEGIILGTGDVSIAAWTNEDGATSEDGGGCAVVTCAPLNAVAGDILNDVAVLEFDFVPTSDSIQFEYVFGSEEYPEYVCSSYNDAFGFFLSGQNPSGGAAFVNRNIALIPGTNTPITINTVNGGADEWATADDCDETNGEYYVDNTTGHTVEYDGFTTVLTAASRVVPHTTYHLVIAIGDAADYSYDSGVFLKANSLTSVSDTIYDTICYGQCYDFFDSTVCDAGVYSHEVGYDVMWLYLEIRDYPVHYETVRIVENELPYAYCGRMYTDDVRNDSIILTNEWGCDSLVVFNLYVSRNALGEYDTTICDNEFPLRWLNHTFERAGEYRDTLRTSQGADSILVFRINENPTYEHYESGAICQGEVFEYEGREFRSQGVHTIRYVSAEGCDSLMYLDLTVYEMPKPHIRLEPEMVDYENQMVVILDRSENSVRREWTIGGEEYGGESTVRYMYPVGEDSVVVQIVSVNGDRCTDTGYATIYMDKCVIWVPNVFTPSKVDNNLFGVSGLCITDYEMWIYNRGGMVVFHSTDKDEKWDGTNQRTGRMCDSGAYTWRMNYRLSSYPDVKRSGVGVVTILR